MVELKIMLKVKKIKIKNSLEECESINLIIGPNNSGKTTLLEEIYQPTQSAIMPQDFKWVNEVEIQCESPKDVVLKLLPKIFKTEDFESVKDIKKAGFGAFSPNINSSDLWNQRVFHEACQAQSKKETYTILKNLNQDDKWYLWRFFLNSFTVNENCEQRLQGPFNTVINNLIGEQQSNVLSYLYTNSDILKTIQKNIQEVFKIKIGFDDLEQGEKHLRILPYKKIKGQTNLPETAQMWQQKSPVIERQGHGIKAYLKLVFSLLQPNKRIIFIDEPETFLHPPQRRALGNLVAKIVKKEDNQVFIATHDPEFLRGILASGVLHIKIFYLKPESGKFSYKTFNAVDIESLIVKNRSNLLNERILNSFFYKKTILCEYEDDRVFYENASARYWWSLFQDVNFIGFGGMDEVLEMFKKLKQIGIETKIIVDIDFLIYRKFPENISDEGLKTKFGDFKKSFKVNGNISEKESKERIKKFKKEGIKYIEDAYPKIVELLKEILNGFKKHSIYVVDLGEFESFTNSNHKDLQHALSMIQSKKKRKLSIFLKDILN